MATHTWSDELPLSDIRGKLAREWKMLLVHFLHSEGRHANEITSFRAEEAGWSDNHEGICLIRQEIYITLTDKDGDEETILIAPENGNMEQDNGDINIDWC